MELATRPPGAGGTARRSKRQTSCSHPIRHRRPGHSRRHPTLPTSPSSCQRVVTPCLGLCFALCVTNRQQLCRRSSDRLHHPRGSMLGSPFQLRPRGTKEQKARSTVDHQGRSRSPWARPTRPYCGSLLFHQVQICSIDLFQLPFREAQSHHSRVG